MPLYLKMHLVFENTCMHLYSNIKNILRKIHALIFEHEMTLIIKNDKYFDIKMLICNVICFVRTCMVCITLLIHHLSIISSRCALYNVISRKQLNICIYYINISLVASHHSIYCMFALWRPYHWLGGLKT